MSVKGKYTCIFGGGAVRGLAYIGAVKALRELQIDVDTYAGSSVGSIIAALLAAGFSTEELKSTIFGVNFELFKDIHFSINKDFALSKGNIFTEWIREAIEKKFYGDDYKKGKNKPVTFKDIKSNLIILTTDLSTFCPVEFSNLETPDFEIATAVRISCSMPGLMTPVEIDGKRLVDGDLLKGIPLWRLSKNINSAKNRIIEFRLEGDTVDKKGNPFEFLNSIYSCMTAASTDFIMDVYGNNDKYDYVKITTGGTIVIDFNISKEIRAKLVEIGYNDSMKYLTKDCVTKKALVARHYKQLITYVDKLIKALKFSNVEDSEEVLKDLYLYMSDAYKYVDSEILEGLWTLKNDILSAPKKKTFFQKVKFKDREPLVNSAEIIDKTLKIKREELIDYVECLG